MEIKLKSESKKRAQPGCGGGCQISDADTGVEESNSPILSTAPCSWAGGGLLLLAAQWWPGVAA